MIQDLRFVEREIEYDSGFRNTTATFEEEKGMIFKGEKVMHKYKQKILQAYDGKEWKDAPLVKEG